ncbi:MAG TPA: hypothetical protein VGQ12_08070 [Candidatus Angelobacter sp.]|jgi:hypothetical protein|nr:hypothetical protein [Candidatus Angelobacter sp.]
MSTVLHTPAISADDARFAELCILCGRGVAVSKMPDGRYAHLSTLVCEANKLRQAMEGQGIDMARLMVDSFMTESCPFDKTVKRKMEHFCWKCWKPLPASIKADLRRRFGDGLRLVAFIQAMALLKRKQKDEAVST